ncbi:MAG: DUF4339 domain-containing protein [Planctomycetia bacterium]|nr:DUF4339 domain-containing protein [Planctomycetia bacterium]
MEQVDYRCPHCSAVIKAPPSLEGESGFCPKCKADVDRWPAPVSGSRPPVQQLPAPPAPTQAAVWYYMVGDKRRGPITEAQLKALAESGSLRPTDMVWRDGMPGWVAASWLPGLFPPLPASQPPAVIQPPQPPAPVVIQPPAPLAQAAPVAQPARRDTQECPYCSEIISIRAKRCPVCGETVDVAMREAEEARREAGDARREARRRPRREREVVVYRDKPTCPHVLHLVLTVLTLGLWLPIWIIHAIVVEAS